MKGKVKRVILLFAVFALTAGVGCSEEATSADEESAEEFEGLEPEDPEGFAQAGKADDPTLQWPALGPMPEQCTFEEAVLPLFTPDDPAVTIELEQIDRVLKARLDDPAQYAEGTNPYRIRYAIYNLSSQSITQWLLDAEAHGVDVQVLIEADQLHKEWNKAADRFNDAGLEVVYDHNDLTDASRVTADLVGISDYGLMHLKTRIFSTPDKVTLLTGSLNPNQSAGANEENIQLLTDPALIASYAEAYSAQLESRKMVNHWNNDSAVNVMFSPVGSGVRANQKLFEWLKAEDEQILLMVFSLRTLTAPGESQSLVDLLKSKHEQGIPVVVITDRKQSDGVDMHGNKVFWDDQTDDRLRDAGIPVYEAINDALAYYDEPYPYSAMHHKTAVLGLTHTRVITDASNWTKAALGNKSKLAKNVESMLFIDSGALDDNRTGYRYLGQWTRVLKRYAHQSVSKDGEGTFEAVLDRLMANPQWPTIRIRFEAEAHTKFGEEIYVLGGHEKLGNWGDAHQGVKLSTTAETYPVWSSEDVEFLLGESFEWKLVARSRDGVRWEEGPNRSQTAMWPVCGTPIAYAKWH